MIRLANLILEGRKYGHTIWITPKGKMIDIPTGSTTHYDYIAKNFKKLFGRDFKDKSEIFDKPLFDGWIHIRNHMSEIAVEGRKESIKKHGKLIWKIIDDRLMNSDFNRLHIALDWMYPESNGRMRVKRGPFLELPEEESKLKPFIGRP
jgi:hypothetical protein